MKRLLIALMLFPTVTWASPTHNATGTTLAAVQAAVNAAHEGDTVTIPAGSSDWGSGKLTISKAITLQGAGVGQTILINNYAGEMLSMSTQAGKTYRITGIEFRGGASQGKYYNGRVKVSGNASDVRIHDNKFQDMQGTGLRFSGYVRGVVDSNLMVNGGQIYIDHATWGNVGAWGDNSWAQPVLWGAADTNGDQWIYIEDNTWIGAPSPAKAQAGVDSAGGARWVFRHNILVDTHILQHGTDSGARVRGTRANEVYENTFSRNGPNFSEMMEVRSGSGTVYNNTITQYNRPDALKVFRRQQAYGPWGACNGSNGWDENSDGFGYACLDQVGRGVGNLFSGGATKNDPPTTPSTPTWPMQTLEGWYSWNNMVDGLTENAEPYPGAFDDVLDLGRDYFHSARPGYTAYQYPHALRGPDTTPPTLSSAVIDTTGLLLTLTFSEVIDIGGGGNGGVVLTPTGTASTAVYASLGNGTTATVVYDLLREIQYNETATVDYTQPGDGIEDAAGNDVVSFFGSAVTNNSQAGASGTVADPVYGLAAGPYSTTTGAKSTTITTSTGGASIYYTTDGSTPTSQDILYSGAINLTVPVTLRAIGIKAGENDSAVVDSTYEIDDWDAPPDQSFMTFPLSQETGTFNFSFKVDTNDAAHDLVIGFGPNPCTAFTDIAVIPWFNHLSAIQARNGGSYTAVNVVNYDGGQTWLIAGTIVIDPPSSSSYSFTANGNIIASGYSFRTEQAAAADLDNMCIRNADGSARVYALTWGAAAPAIDSVPRTPGGLQVRSGIGGGIQ